MKILYTSWDHAKASYDKRLDDLMKLFRQLLNMSAGDVDHALEWLDRIGQRYGLWDEDLDFEKFKAELEKSGEVERDPRSGSGEGGGAFKLTPRGENMMRKSAFREIFGELQKGGAVGEHKARVTGTGGESEPTVRPYKFGDELWNINAPETIKNAVRSSMSDGYGADLSIGRDDLVVNETQMNTTCATALLVDCSHSMILYGEDRMTPARTVAMALIELIQKQYPRDRLFVVAFGDDAREVPLKQVPYLSWGPYHTNTKAALQMGRKLLERSKCPNRQIFMITDGKPTVLDEGGRRIIDSGWLNPRIVNRTLDEAAACRRKNIPITTFMVTEDPWLREFIEELTEINRGKAYYTGTGKLGEFLLVDYMNNRKKKLR